MAATFKSKNVSKGRPPTAPKATDNANQTLTYTAEQLQNLLSDASIQYERLKAARLHLQIEGDMIARFREASQRKQGRLDRKVLLHDASVEQLIKRQRAEVAAYEQKIESIDYAHKQLKQEIRVDGEGAVRAEDLSADAALAEEDRCTARIEAAADKQRRSFEQDISTFEKTFEQHLIKLRERLVQNLGNLAQKYEDQYEKAREVLQLREKVEMHEVEERKNLHINDLMASHRSAFEQIKAYYNDITHDNLHLIKELRKEIADLKARAKIRHKQMQETQNENLRLTEPLRQQEQLKCKLEQQLRFCVKDRLALQNIRARDMQLEDKIKAAKQSNHQVEQRKHKLERDIEDCTRRLNGLQDETTLRTQAKVILYEQKAEKLLDALEEMYRQRSDLLCKQNVDFTAAVQVHDSLRRTMCVKNDEVATLRHELQKAVKTYQDTVLALKSRLKELGIDSVFNEVLIPAERGFISQAPAPYITTIAAVAKGNTVLAL